MKLNDYKDRSAFYDLEFSDTSDTDFIFNNLLTGFKGRILEIFRYERLHTGGLR